MVGTRRCFAAAVTTLALVVSSAPAAWAHGEGETTEGYVLVQQALGHLAHDTGHVGIDQAMEKVDDALATEDQQGVDVAEVTRAKVLLEAHDVVQARQLLQQSIAAATSKLPAATGEMTGTTIVHLPLRGRDDLSSSDWVVAGGSLLLALLGLGLAIRFRPHDNLRQLRRQLTHADDGSTPEKPSGHRR